MADIHDGDGVQARDTMAIIRLREALKLYGNKPFVSIFPNDLRDLLTAFDNLVADDEDNATLRAQLAAANARAEKAEAVLVQRSDFWTSEHIEQFMKAVRKNLPDGARVVVSHGYDDLEGKVGTVLGAIHFIEQAAAKVSVDFGDGTEYVPSNLLRVVTDATPDADTEADDAATENSAQRSV